MELDGHRNRMQANRRVRVMGQVEENVQKLVPLIDSVLYQVNKRVHAKVVALFVLAKSGQQPQTVPGQVRNRANDLGKQTKRQTLQILIRPVTSRETSFDLQV